MSESDHRRLVLLDSRFPGTSRMTRYRISREPDFPTPIIIRGRKYFYEDELEAFESRRRVGKTTPKRSAAAEATS